MNNRLLHLWIFILLTFAHGIFGQKRPLEPLDAFKLNYVDNPRISPDGETIAFLKKGYDIMTDKQTSQLWMVKFDGSGLRPISPAGLNVSNPVWSPDGERLAWIASGKERHQLIMRYIDEGEESVLADFDKGPSSLAWSPDGKWLAYIQFVAKKNKSFIEMPLKPDGADWAPAPTFSNDIVYRSDGRGDLPEGYNQIFILSANGGSAVQISDLDYNVNAPISWSSNSTEIYFSAQDREELKGDFYESDLFMIDVTYGGVKRVTDKRGADFQPTICSPRNQLAWLGFANDYNSHQQLEIYYSANKRDVEAVVLTEGFDR
jgi:acylaminoacyl-peptidase